MRDITNNEETVSARFAVPWKRVEEIFRERRRRAVTRGKEEKGRATRETANSRDWRVNKNAEKLEHANIFRRARDRAIPKSLARCEWGGVRRSVANLARKKPPPAGDMYMQGKLNIHAVQIRVD